MTTDASDFASRAEACDASEKYPSNPSVRESFGDIVQSRYVSRRSMLRSVTAVAAITAIATPLETLVSRAARAATRGFDFPEISHGVDETHNVAEGYAGDVLIRWGDRCWLARRTLRRCLLGQTTRRVRCFASITNTRMKR